MTKANTTGNSLYFKMSDVTDGDLKNKGKEWKPCSPIRTSVESILTRVPLKQSFRGDLIPTSYHAPPLGEAVAYDSAA